MHFFKFYLFYLFVSIPVTDLYPRSNTDMTDINIVPNHFVIFEALWLNLYNDKDKNIVFHCINICQVPKGPGKCK